MDNSQKQQLVSALASAMGRENYDPSKHHNQTIFDNGTKTLYCQGRVISGTTIDEALAFFRGAKQKNERLGENDAAIRNVNMYYQIAIEAITMMINGDSDDGK